MVEKTSEAKSGTSRRLLKPSDPAQAKAPVAALNEVLPDDQLDTVSSCAGRLPSQSITLAPAAGRLQPRNAMLNAGQTRPASPLTPFLMPARPA